MALMGPRPRQAGRGHVQQQPAAVITDGRSAVQQQSPHSRYAQEVSIGWRRCGRQRAASPSPRCLCSLRTRRARAHLSQGAPDCPGAARHCPLSVPSDAPPPPSFTLPSERQRGYTARLHLHRRTFTACRTMMPPPRWCAANADRSPQDAQICLATLFDASSSLIFPQNQRASLEYFGNVSAKHEFIAKDPQLYHPLPS